MSTVVTEPLVDAKDEARQAEVRTDLAKALLSVEQRITAIALWLAALIVAVGIGVAGLVITVLR